MKTLVELINTYGFPIVAAAGLGYMVYYVWKWSTQDVRPAIKEANTVLVALIDRVRMLDNDLIRLNEKIDVAIDLGTSAETRRRILVTTISKKQ